VKELRGLGIQPDIIILRSEKEITDSIKEKNQSVLQCAQKGGYLKFRL
jgi:CTP synthase (UTP-ammonia lyase)